MFHTVVYLTVLSQLEPRSKGSLGNPIQGGGAEQREGQKMNLGKTEEEESSQRNCTPLSLDESTDTDNVPKE